MRAARGVSPRLANTLSRTDARPALCAASLAAPPPQRSVLLLRCTRLAETCLRALAGSPGVSGDHTSALTSCLITLTAARSWAPPGGHSCMEVDDAPQWSPADWIVARLSSHGLFATLRALLLASGSLHGALAGHLWSRASQQGCAVQGSTQLWSLPLLSSSCPALAPLLPHLWAPALEALTRDGALQLPPDPRGYSAHAWLLGNLLEAAPDALHAALARSQHAQHAAALAFAAAAERLLPMLPPGALGGGEADQEEENEEDSADTVIDARRRPAAAAASGVPTPSVPPPAELLAQLHMLSEGALLRDLVHAALPETSVPSATDAAAGMRVCSLLRSGLDRLRGPERLRMLASLAFTADVVPRLWPNIRSAAHSPAWLPALSVFSQVYSYQLVTADDEDFYKRGVPLSLDDNTQLVTLLRDALWQLLWLDASPAGGSCRAACATAKPLARLYMQLHARNGRRCWTAPDSFCRPEFAGGEGGVAERALQEALSDEKSRAAALLRTAPALMPFHLRARLFREKCYDAREMAITGAAPAVFGSFRSTLVTIRRDILFEDGFAGLGALPPEALRGLVRVRFVNELGADEAGVDGGGLFKDFMDGFWSQAFDPRRGLWRSTAAHTLHPSADSAQADQRHLELFRFQGVMVAKALYEGILAEVPFADFFLAKLRGDGNELNDLASLDEALYRSLLSLKRYSGDHAALCIAFTAPCESGAPGSEEVELVPGGRDVAVTAANKLTYIHLVANYRLTQATRAQCAAFTSGFHALVPCDWVRLFSARELATLLSGTRAARLDVGDLARHAAYSGGYDAEHPTVRALWAVLEELTGEQQAAFLKFVTACSRAPLLGFKYLEPQFTVHRAGIPASDAPDAQADQERLPSAATCMSLLKLPPYANKRVLRDKLVYAISCGAGFDLS